MLGKFRRCESDEDYARFTLYFIRHRKQFHAHFTLYDTLSHILRTIKHSRIILIEDLMGNVVGWGQYYYYTAEYEEHPSGEIAFVDSVILDDSFRSSRLFYQGFRYLANQIAEENPSVKLFEFCVLEDHAYLNRLYAKFATPTGKRDGHTGTVTIYSTEFDRLFAYLNRRNMTN